MTFDKQVNHLFVIGGLLVCILISALTVIYLSHNNRNLRNELQMLQKQYGEQQVEWGRLLLEQSTLAAYSNIESVAKRQLNMKQPDVDNVILVTP